PALPSVPHLRFVLVLVPLPWHLQAWNSGTCFYMMWTALAGLNQFVNSVVWRDDMVNRAPVWCDICALHANAPPSIRITMAVSVGIPAASLCINRCLYHIASVKSVSISPAEKRRAALIDTLICVLFPLLYLPLQYIVQGHRFNIYQQVGCYLALYNSVPMYLLSLLPPPLLGLASGVYGVLALRAFLRRRAAFAQFLSAHSSASSGLTQGRYLRLCALALTSTLLLLPLAIFAIALNATAMPISPYRSLADTHFMFSRVEGVPALFWRGDKRVELGVEFTRWAGVGCAFVFFGFFGAAVEARRNYGLAWAAVAALFWRVAGRLGVRRP
ncbi:fungal pheromone STE3G-protein-coupled receptor, partial [Mycena latifolia]